MDLTDNVVSLLKSRGVLPTPQRLEVGKILFAMPQHLSAEQIIARVRVNGAHVSKATVYNTLNLFVSRGLAREVHVDPSRAFYDSTTTPHHHFFNVDTGKLTDIPPDAVRLEGVPETPKGTVGAGVEVVIRVRNSV